jgi:hypothetical protein
MNSTATNRRVAELACGKSPPRGWEAAARHQPFTAFRELRLPRVVVMSLLAAFPLLGKAQSLEAISREVSVVNRGAPLQNSDFTSREVSVVNSGGLGVASQSLEAVSREVSVVNRGSLGVASQSLEAISREVSVVNYGAGGVPSTQSEAISREVSVRNVGVNVVTVAVGSAGVVAGNSGSVPVTLSSYLPLTNLSLAVDFPPTLLSNWTVQPQSPYAGSLFVSNSSRLYLTFSNATAGQTLPAAVVGRLAFASASNQPSAFLPLPVSTIRAPVVNYGYNSASQIAAQNGEVEVIRTNSLLRAYQGTNHTRYLALYGLAGTNYTLQSTTNLAPPINWTTVLTALMPSDMVVLTPNLGTTNRAIFYRAQP